MSAGQLDVLSVGRGHLRITVTTTGKKDREAARETIEGMLRKGYAIFVEVEPGKPLERVKGFDPRRMEYLVDVDPKDARGRRGESAGGLQPGSGRKVTPLSPSRRARIPAGKAKATVVGRTAGG